MAAINREPTLYELLGQAGLTKQNSPYIDSHESDLYVEINETTLPIVEAWFAQEGIDPTDRHDVRVGVFNDQVTGRPTWEIPLGYLDEWVKEREQEAWEKRPKAELQELTEVDMYYKYVLTEKGTILYTRDDPYPADDPNPRLEGFGHVFTWLQRYNSPDPSCPPSPEIFAFEYLDMDYEIGEELLWADMVREAERRGDVLLPVSKHEHSDVTYYVDMPQGGPDHFDHGFAGLAYASNEEIGEYFGLTPNEAGEYELTDEVKQQVREVFETEIARYTQWANGDLYEVFANSLTGEEVGIYTGLYDPVDVLEGARGVILGEYGDIDECIRAKQGLLGVREVNGDWKVMAPPAIGQARPVEETRELEEAEKVREVIAGTTVEALNQGRNVADTPVTRPVSRSQNPTEVKRK